MKRKSLKTTASLCLLSAGLLVGCGKAPVDHSVVVDERVEVSDRDTAHPSFPRYLPEGTTQYDFDLIGFEDTDGTFYPVMPALTPTPRGGSVSPIHIEGNKIRIFKGREPLAADNELLGTFVVADAPEDLAIKFSITESGALRLALEDLHSKKEIPIRRSEES